MYDVVAAMMVYYALGVVGGRADTDGVVMSRDVFSNIGV